MMEGSPASADLDAEAVTRRGASVTTAMAAGLPLPPMMGSTSLSNDASGSGCPGSDPLPEASKKEARSGVEIVDDDDGDDDDDDNDVATDDTVVATCAVSTDSTTSGTTTNSDNSGRGKRVTQQDADKKMSRIYSELDIDALNKELHDPVDTTSDDQFHVRSPPPPPNGNNDGERVVVPAPPPQVAAASKSLSTSESFMPQTPPVSAHSSRINIRTDRAHDTSQTVGDKTRTGLTPEERELVEQHHRLLTASTSSASSTDFHSLPDSVKAELERLEEEQRYVEEQVSIAKRRASCYFDSVSGQATLEFRHEAAKTAGHSASSGKSNANNVVNFEGQDDKALAQEVFTLFDMDSDQRFDTQDLRLLVGQLRGSYPDDALSRAFLEFDAGLKDYWDVEDFQRWFTSNHLKAPDREMLLEFLSDEEFRSFIDTKQRLMREELDAARTAAQSRFRDIHPTICQVSEAQIQNFQRSASQSFEDSKALIAPIAKERQRRQKEARFVAHSCDFTRERLLLVLKTAKGRAVVDEEVAASGDAIRKKVQRIINTGNEVRRAEMVAETFFALFDMDKNNQLDSFELGMLLDDLEQPFSEFELSQLMLEAGTTLKGSSITMPEFLQIVTGKLKPTINLGLHVHNLEKLLTKKGSQAFLGTEDPLPNGDDNHDEGQSTPFQLLYVRQMMMMETVASTVVRSTAVFREVYPCFVEDADALIEKSGKSPMARPTHRRASIVKIQQLLNQSNGSKDANTSPRKKRMQGNFRASIVGADMTPFELLKGYLQKRSSTFSGTSQRRFFVLNNEYLNYYKKEEDFQTSPVKKLAGTFSLKLLALVDKTDVHGNSTGKQNDSLTVIKLMFTDHTVTELVAETARMATTWAEQIDMRRRWFQDIDNAEASATRMKMHTEMRQRQILERHRRRGGSRDETGTPQNRLLDDIQKEHVAEVLALHKTAAAKLEQQQQEHLQLTLKLKKAHAEQLEMLRTELAENREAEVRTATEHLAQQLEIQRNEHISLTSHLKESVRMLTTSESQACTLARQLQRNCNEQASTILRQKAELEQMRQDLSQTRLKLERAGKTEHELRESIRELEPLRKEVAQLAVAVQAFPQERQHLLDELKQFQDEHQSQLAQSINAEKKRHALRIASFCHEQARKMKATPNNDSPSANRAACKIGAFLRRTVSRQTAKAKRRQLLRSSNGLKWFHIICAELDQKLRVHTQPNAVDMSIFAVLQHHFMSVEQFLHVARGVDTAFSLQGQKVRLNSVAQQAQCLYVRSIRTNYLHAQNLMARSKLGSTSSRNSTMPIDEELVARAARSVGLGFLVRHQVLKNLKVGEGILVVDVDLFFFF